MNREKIGTQTCYISIQYSKMGIYEAQLYNSALHNNMDSYTVLTPTNQPTCMEQAGISRTHTYIYPNNYASPDKIPQDLTIPKSTIVLIPACSKTLFHCLSIKLSSKVNVYSA